MMGGDIVQMRRFKLGLLLTLMMFGHNFVLNQTQSMQKPLEDIHDISVMQFNLLYSLPSAISILFIVPMGFFYLRIANKLLITGAIMLSLGQLLVSLFGGEDKPWYFEMLMGGRIIQGIGAEILYMIQGNMASSWMGRYAGIIFILPEFGQIANVFVTPWVYTLKGVNFSFFIGFLTCLVSSVACIFIYFGLRTSHALKSFSDEAIVMTEQQVTIEMAEEVRDEASMHLPRVEKPEEEHGEIGNGEMGYEEMRQVEEHVPKNIFEAGRVTWLVLVLCGVNECLYFPFLDNANELVTNRFCIPYDHTGYYLAIPFLTAMLTSAVSSYWIPRVPRHQLIFYVSFFPLIGHSLIFLDFNCDKVPTLYGQAMLVAGLFFFGIGIGTYYSYSFPGVGLSVPYQIRGMAYACMALFQTIAMALIPIVAGVIIESEGGISTLSEGYREESLLFVVICLVGVVVSLLIYCLGREDSFRFNDEEDLQKEEGKHLLKDSTFRSQETE